MKCGDGTAIVFHLRVGDRLPQLPVAQERSHGLADRVTDTGKRQAGAGIVPASFCDSVLLELRICLY